MPIYEYACQACGHEFETMQKMSDPPVKKCPECGKPKVEKQLSVGSFQLKGGGWYADGYASSKGSGSGSGSGSSTTSDTSSSAASEKSSGSSEKKASSSKSGKKTKASAKAA